MEYLVYFLTLLGLFCAAFFVTALFSSKLLDNIVVLTSANIKEPIKGDEANLLINGEKIEAIVDDVIYDEDNLTRKIVLTALR